MSEVCVSPYAWLPQTDSSGFPLQSGWGWKLPSCACNNTQHPTSASVSVRVGKRVRGGTYLQKNATMCVQTHHYSKYSCIFHLLDMPVPVPRESKSSNLMQIIYLYWHRPFSAEYPTPTFHPYLNNI